MNESTSLSSRAVHPVSRTDAARGRRRYSSWSPPRMVSDHSGASTPRTDSSSMPPGTVVVGSQS